MKVKRFVGNSMQDAIAQLKATFGQDAVILHTKRFRQGPFGLFGLHKVEVIAAVDMTVPNHSSSDGTGFALEEVKRQLQEVKSLLKPQGNTITPWEDIYLQLTSEDVAPNTAKSLVEKLAQTFPRNSISPEEVKMRFRELLIAEFKSAPLWDLDNKQRIIALVGPTGVGKTTTIAKLAANFALFAHKKVGLITVDTYRIAAVDQLRTYADLIGVPIEVAFTPGELSTAMERLKNRDLILIDTAGRSQYNQMHLAELKAFLEQISPDEIHLVLSATTKLKDTTDIIDRFSVLPIKRLIMTKLDETTTYGMLYNAQHHSGQTLAYLTTGQNVPEDIEVADPEKIATMVLGEL